MSKSTYSDEIDTLPTDESSPTHSEIQIVDTLFKEKYNTVQKVLNHSKDVLAVGFIFLLFCLPQIDSIIKKICPSCEKSEYILILIKTFVFMILYFVIKNIYLIKT